MAVECLFDKFPNEIIKERFSLHEIKPLHVLRVDNLNASILFYRDKLGFTMGWFDPDQSAAGLMAPGEVELYLTSNPDLDISSLFPEGEENPDPVPAKNLDDIEDALTAFYQEKPEEWHGTDEPKGEEEHPSSPEEEEQSTQPEEQQETPVPSRTVVEQSKEEPLDLPGHDLYNYQERLVGFGVADMLLEVSPGVEQVLTVHDPDGYQLAFHESLQLSDEEVLELYRKGPDLLEGTIMGLTEEDLDQVPEGEEWTIRQIVLHMVDFDLEMMHRIKWALADPGRSYPIPLFEPAEWAETFNYQNRSIQGELAMFRLLREHILLLCSGLSDALDRSVVSEKGKVEVRTMMQVVGETAQEQVQQILDARFSN